MDGQVKVTDKTADDDDLLGIFLTEEGFVGAGNIDQLGDDGCYATEMDRSLSTAEFMRNIAVDIDVCAVAPLGYHFPTVSGWKTASTPTLSSFRQSSSKRRG